MGLDISAVSNIAIVALTDSYKEGLEDVFDVQQDFINEHFPHAVPPRAVGKTYIQWRETDTSKEHHFRAGSYSGFGLFRSTLASYSMGCDSYSSETRESFWNDIHEGRYNDSAFYEIINFSDCEGTFFGPVCDTIYVDFRQYREDYVRFITDNSPFPAWESSYFINRYDDFTKAFDLARHDGLVSFH